MTHILFVLLVATFWAPAPLQSQVLEDWGNPFTLGGSTIGPTLTATTRFSGRFTAQDGLTADQVIFRTGLINGTPSMRITIHADDDGVPGNQIATTNTIDLTSANSNGSISANLTSNAVLTAGEVYHFVYEPVSVDATNTIVIAATSGSDIRWSPKTGNLDPELNRLFSTNSGATWSENANQANATMQHFALRNSTTLAVEGQVIAALYFGGSDGIGDQRQHGQQFIYEGPDKHFAEEITLRLAQGTGTALGELRLQIFDNDDTLLRDQLLLADGSSLATSFDLYTFAFDNPLQLDQGESYRMVLLSPTSNANSYRAYTPRTLFSGYNEGTFQGTDGFAVFSLNGGSSFTSLFDGDMYFNFTLNPVPEASSLALLAVAGLLVLARRHRRKTGLH